MVYLVFPPFVGRVPGHLVDISVWKERPSDDEVVSCAEFHQPLSILINGAINLKLLWRRLKRSRQIMVITLANPPQVKCGTRRPPTYICSQRH